MPSELKQECIYLRYNSSLDVYARPYHKEIESNEGELASRTPTYFTEIFSQGWQSMAMRYKNISRKVEKDWKMVYIARKQGTESHKEGVIEWVVDLTGTDYCVKDVTLFATMAAFEDRSKVVIGVIDDSGRSRELTLGSPPLTSCPIFAGAKTLRLSARLYNEKDNDDPSVWQKAQLFRQKAKKVNENVGHLTIILQPNARVDCVEARVDCVGGDATGMLRSRRTDATSTINPVFMSQPRGGPGCIGSSRLAPGLSLEKRCRRREVILEGMTDQRAEIVGFDEGIYGVRRWCWWSECTLLNRLSPWVGV
ncbi:unnamed protein product [Rodentolepis nana]|uniref:PAW domain-containing protein n=1 Tax=Rodentolepis nana TaxID=102285 RepID=A0A0R3TGX6_RODNA|nr:unnamed protein product [Rodentolepis nana]